MTLLIVIVNYRTADLTLDCLRSLQDEVATVAGDARGRDRQRLGRRLGRAARGRRARQRLGAPGRRSNPWDTTAGSRPATTRRSARRLAAADPPRYVLLLNPDTIVRPGALRTLVDFLEGRPDVGIAGSRLEEPDGIAAALGVPVPLGARRARGGLRFGPVSRLLARWVVAPPVPARAGRSTGSPGLASSSAARSSRRSA